MKLNFMWNNEEEENVSFSFSDSRHSSELFLLIKKMSWLLLSNSLVWFWVWWDRRMNCDNDWMSSSFSVQKIKRSNRRKLILEVKESYVTRMNFLPIVKSSSAAKVRQKIEILSVNLKFLLEMLISIRLMWKEPFKCQSKCQQQQT